VVQKNNNPSASQKKICVLGAGSWGTALASLLASNKHEVDLWGRDGSLINSIKNSGINEKYLPGIFLSKNLNYTNDFNFAVSNADIIVISTPSNTLNIILKQIKEVLDFSKNTENYDKQLLLTCKGFNPDTGAFLSNSIDDIFSDAITFSILSGPSFAVDLANGLPTSVVVASKSSKVAKDMALIFHSNHFRVYDNTDIYGVQLGGAVKNIIAFMAGIADGLKLGSNSHAALITRGLNEIIKLGKAMKDLKVKTNTLIGLSGLGDLVLTAGDNKSRNRRFGLYMAQGSSLEKALESVGQTVESRFAVKHAYHLAEKYNIELPITEQAYNILYKDLPVKEAIKNLLSRAQKSEY